MIAVEHDGVPADWPLAAAMILEAHPTWSFGDLEATPRRVLQAIDALRTARNRKSRRDRERGRRS